MPQIVEYNAPIGLAPRPTDMALNTAREVGTAENRFAREAGASVGGAIEHVGGEVGQIIDNQITMHAISKGAAAASELYANMTQQWNQLAAKTDPNDGSIADTFKQGTLGPELEKFQDSFNGSSPRAQEWAMRQTDAMRGDFMRRITADMSTRDGTAVVRNMEDMKRNFANIASQSPDTLPFIKDSVTNALEAQISAHTHLSGDVAAKMREELVPSVMKEVSRNAMNGIGLRDPEQLAKEINSGKWGEYFTPEEQQRMMEEALRFREAKQRDADRTFLEQRRQAEQVSEKTAGDYLTQLSQGPVSDKALLADQRLLPQERISLIRFNDARTKELIENRENAQHPVAFNALMTAALKDSQAGVPFNQRRVDESYMRGDISFGEWGKASAMGKREDSPFEHTFNQQYLRASADVRNSLWGQINRTNQGVVSDTLNRMQADAIATIDQYRAEGKDVRPLLDPNSDQYLFSQSRIQSYTGTPRQQMSAQADAVRKTGAGRPTPPPEDIAAAKSDPQARARFMKVYGMDPDQLAVGSIGVKQ